MNTSDGVGLAPEVEAILDAARSRTPPATGDPSPGDSSTGDPSPGDSSTGTIVDVDARSLRDAFAVAEADDRVPVIAEVKPTSPTTDGTREDDPVALAREMVAGGAAALSVLTEPAHFGGSTENLERVRDAVDVPVLRKDFLLRERDLDRVESDVVLLIARFLSSSTTDHAGVEGADDLESMLAAARDRGFQALVEVHTEAELERALDAGATLVGVNNRDLAKLDVDLGTFERVADAVPAGARGDVTLIAESGVATTDDVTRMRRAGADALLVGSAIMDGDVRENTQRLATAPDPATTETADPATTETAGDTIEETTER